MTTAPPAAVTQDLDRLSQALDATIPARTDTNLLVATWNVRAFGDITAKWAAGPQDSPQTGLACRGMYRRSHLPLRRRCPAGSTAQHQGTVVSARAAGTFLAGDRLRRHRRLCRQRGTPRFLYDSDRVQPSGLVGEIVLPTVADDPALQFARTPYFAGFSRNGIEFTLASVHVLWGKNAAERLPEVTAFAQWMRAWADRRNDRNTT